MTEGCLSSQLLLESSDVQVLPSGLEAPAWVAALGLCLADKEFPISAYLQRQFSTLQLGLKEGQTAYMLST